MIADLQVAAHPYAVAPAAPAYGANANDGNGGLGGLPPGAQLLLEPLAPLPASANGGGGGGGRALRSAGGGGSKPGSKARARYLEPKKLHHEGDDNDPPMGRPAQPKKRAIAARRAKGAAAGNGSVQSMKNPRGRGNQGNQGGGGGGYDDEDDEGGDILGLASDEANTPADAAREAALAVSLDELYPSDGYFLVVKGPTPYAPCHRYR
jgi:hypothetical protein